MKRRAFARAAASGAVLALALGLAPATAFADVRLEVRAEPTALSLDQRVTLQVNVQARGLGSPDVSLPDFDGFEIVGQQVQRPMQFSINFGQQATVQSRTIYTFVLQPLREGRLVIKPVRAELDGEVETSQPITISVSSGAGQPPLDPTPQNPQHPGAAQQGQSAPAPDASGMIDSAEVDPIAFLRTLVTKAEPYVGEQVTITMYLYVRDRLQSTPSIETEPTTDGLWVQDLMPPSRALQPTRQIVNGQPYAVYALRRIAAFPLQSGEITIGAMSVKIDTSSLLSIFSANRARPDVQRTSRPITLRAKPLPEQNRPQGDVAVGRYTLAAKLDRTQAVTGDAVSLTAVVQGQGNVRTVTLELPQVQGLDVLQPEIKDLMSSPDDLVSGTREYRWLIVPRAPGRYTIPALALHTFDPTGERYARLATEPLALEVVGQALPSAQAPTDSAPDAERPAGGDDGADEPEHAWAPIRTQSALDREPARLVERPWYGYALAAPGLLWLSLIGASALRRAAGARARSSAGRGVRLAQERLSRADAAARAGDAARFHADASAALLALLEARLGEAVTGYTRTQLRQRLRERGMDDALAQAAIEALERAEFARFSSASASPAELARHAASVHELFERLSTFTPARDEAAS